MRISTDYLARGITRSDSAWNPLCDARQELVSPAPSNLCHCRRVLGAHSLPSGMAGLTERVTARALGLEPKLRVIEGGKEPDVRQPLDDSDVKQTTGAATA